MTNDYITTEQAAEFLGIAPATLRTSLCRNGAYFGIKPRKMPNRLLRWPKVEVLKLIGTAPDEPAGHAA